MIKMDIDITGLQALLERLQQTGVNASPLMRRLADIMQDAVEENFAQQGRPRWLGLAPSTLVRRRGGMILQDTGRLASSITGYSDAHTATVGTNLAYAAIHQFGGKTRPHVIRPRNGKALRFNGRFAKQVNHPGSVIPARPFLRLTSGDEAELLDTVEAYLRHLTATP